MTELANRALPAAPRGWGASDRSRAAVLRRAYPTVADLRQRAARRIPKFAFDFMDGGAGDDGCVRRNEQALAAVEVVPRYGIPVDGIATETTLFGRRYAAPIGIAPMGLPGLMWPGAEEYLAPAAQAARIPYVLATPASLAIERAAALAPDVFWFQLYRMPRNEHAIAYDLIRRADTAGAHVLVLTFDSGARTKRARDLRNSLIVPFRLTLRTLFDIATSPAWVAALRKHGVPRFANFVPYVDGETSVAALAGFAQSELTGNHTWDEIARIRDRWKRPLVLKGVMHPLDAERAVALGLDGIVVSNHGGRVLEGAVATIDVLPAIVAQTAGRAVVMMDSGIRSGLDVVRALALGAKAAFAGRPFLFALAALGAEGARHAVELFTEEIRTALAQTGARSVGEAGGISMRHANAMSAADFAGAPALAPEA